VTTHLEKGEIKELLYIGQVLGGEMVDEVCLLVDWDLTTLSTQIWLHHALTALQSVMGSTAEYNTNQ